jgi:hypothetical protein
MDADNVRCLVTDSAFTECAAATGGGAIHLNTRNAHFTLQRSEVSYCSSSDSGGALQMRENNSDARLYMNSFHHNTAGKDGGALALIRWNLRTMIGGCVFAQNSAASSGGNIHVCFFHYTQVYVIVAMLLLLSTGAVYFEDGNINAVVIDKRGFDSYTIMQSDHPYQTGDHAEAIVTQGETVDGGEGCLAWSLHFDAATAMYASDYVTIYDDQVSKNELFRYSSEWPGKHLPAVRIARPSFYVEFQWENTEYSSKPIFKTALYGFKLYCAPVYANATDKTVISDNIAAFR